MEEADRRRIQFRDRNFRKNSKPEIVKEYPFYFATKNEKMSFLLMDSIFNSIEFTTENILTLQKKEP